ncbi:MAG: alpha-L-fucosidase [Bacteroidota bacterium]|nr:alpha-L-fucosidase [Bacteroidota bacterium]
MKKIFFIFLLMISFRVMAQKQIPVGPLPTQAQLQWQDMEFYFFAHFGPNTFTDLEWGKGTEHEEVFNPTQLDCRQWCRVAKEAGAKGIIITAKHHDGFCLWPSKFSTHTVRESKWKDGKGDVLKELSAACKEYGLKFGVYISPWDRNHPKYGTAEYNDVFVGMMKELFSNYGPITELWWDGANGEGPNGKKQVYDWHLFEKTVRDLSPNTVVFSDIGPDIRWVGNENGIAGKTNWNLLDTAGFTRGLGAPNTDTLNQGNVNGKNWIPAECDVSIRPGWFYHATEDDKIKSPEKLFDLYLKSVGRGANLLLNVPPDRRGLINEKDEVALIAFKKLRDQSFKNNLLKHAIVIDNKHTDKTVNYKTEVGKMMILKEPVKLNCLVLKEQIQNGQFIKNLHIILSDHGTELRKISVTTVGKKRVVTFPTVEVTELSFVITNAKSKPQLENIEGYLIDEKLIEKE